jgi:hypothetical protein
MAETVAGTVIIDNIAYPVTAQITVPPNLPRRVAVAGMVIMGDDTCIPVISHVTIPPGRARKVN